MSGKVRNVTTPLARRLGLGDAIAIGLGSMIGAGVFVVFAPAAAAAGAGLLIGLVVAGLVAFGNATSTAQLAAASPTSGGAYAYGREHLGPWWGFIAGWGFVIGKTASCAAMAMAFAAYAAPAGWERPLAIVAVITLVGINLLGVTRTAAAARAIVVVVLAVLSVVVAAGGVTLGSASVAFSFTGVTAYGVLQSAGLIFFAFAGYARIATLGEEVAHPERTIPRAIVTTLVVAFTVYLFVGAAALLALGPERLATAIAPLEEVVAAAGWTWAGPIVRVGAALASLGALLALLAGVGRTTLAMARTGDLPRPLAAVHPRTLVPHRAEIVVAIAVCGIVAAADIRGAIGFSSFGVLVYYLVANAAALRQPIEQRRYPRAFAVAGAIGCVVLAVTLPWLSVIVGLGVIVLGIGWRMLTNGRTATNT